MIALPIAGVCELAALFELRRCERNALSKSKLPEGDGEVASEEKTEAEAKVIDKSLNL